MEERLLLFAHLTNVDGERAMSQAHCQNGTVSYWGAERGTSSALISNAAAFSDSCAPKSSEFFPHVPFETNNEFAGMVEAEFEEELQEFCRFARLGFTILNQPASQLADVGNVLRSLGDGGAADDLLKLVTSGREKAKSLLELTTVAKLRCESAFLGAANGPAARGRAIR